MVRRRNNSLRKLENQILWFVGALCPGKRRIFHGISHVFDGEDWFRKLKFHSSFLKSVNMMIKMSFPEESKRHFCCLWQSLGDNGRQVWRMQGCLFLPDHTELGTQHTERGRLLPAPKTTSTLTRSNNIKIVFIAK